MCSVQKYGVPWPKSSLLNIWRRKIQRRSRWTHIEVCHRFLQRIYISFCPSRLQIHVFQFPLLLYFIPIVPFPLCNSRLDLFPLAIHLQQDIQLLYFGHQYIYEFSLIGIPFSLISFSSSWKLTYVLRITSYCPYARYFMSWIQTSSGLVSSWFDSMSNNVETR